MRSPWLSSAVLQPLFRIFHRRSLRKFLDIHHNIRIRPLAKVSWSHLWTPDRLGVKARQGILFSKKRKCVVGSKVFLWISYSEISLLYYALLPGCDLRRNKDCCWLPDNLLLSVLAGCPLRSVMIDIGLTWYRLQLPLLMLNLTTSITTWGSIREQSPSDTWSPGPTSPFFASTYRWGRVWTPAKFQEEIFKLHFLWILVKDS